MRVDITSGITQALTVPTEHEAITLILSGGIVPLYRVPSGLLFTLSSLFRLLLCFIHCCCFHTYLFDGSSLLIHIAKRLMFAVNYAIDKTTSMYVRIDC